MVQVHVAPPGGWIPEPINPDKWADNMLKAWKTFNDVQLCESCCDQITATYHKGIHVQKKAVSLLNVDEGDPGDLVNTPRSLQACLLLGIDPSEIQYRDVSYFTERGLSKELQDIKYQYNEVQRQGKVKRLIEERERIIKEHDTGSIFVENGKVVQGAGPGGGRSAPTSEAQQKAIAKAEVQRRRMEKEMAKKRKIEEMKKAMEREAKRVAELQRKKAAAQKAEKARKDKEFAAQQFANEQMKLKEEEELEKKARRLAEQKYQEEIKLATARATAAKKAKKLAIQKEKERIRKQDEFRIHLEKMQEELIKKAIQREKEMKAKDATRRKIQEEKAKELAKTNAFARAEAEKRQEAALATWLGFLQKRKDDYEAKIKAQKIKAKEKLILWKKQQAEKKAYEEQKEHDRLMTIKKANDLREKRANENMAKARQKRKMLEKYLVQRELDRKKHNTEQNLESFAQYWRCQQTARNQALHRKQLLDEIERETAKVKALLDARVDIQKQRQLHQAKEMWAQAYGHK